MQTEYETNVEVSEDPMARLYQPGPAPERSKGLAAFRIAEYVELAAPLVIKACLAGEALSTRDYFDRLPQLEAAGVRRANALGDSLGKARDGLDLFRENRNRIAACRENAARALGRMSDADRESLVTECGFESLDQLVDAINELPLAAE